MPKVLVTGGLGYIGSHLKPLLPGALVWDLKRGGDIEACISDPAVELEALNHVETVIHLADRRYQELNSENLPTNVAKHRAFFLRITELPALKKVIFASSCSVYGVAADLVTEASAVNPTSAYAESKLATEEALRASGLPAVVIRFGTAYGQSAQMRRDLLLNQMAAFSVTQEKLELFDLEARRPFIHCRDFAHSLVHACGLPAGSLVNVVESNFSKRAVIDTFRRAGRPLNAQLLPLKDSRDYFVSNEKAVSLGFRFGWDLERGLEEMVNACAAE